MNEADYWSIIDVARRMWDPTEGRHSRHGERPFRMIRGVEVHWVGTGAVTDHGDTASELLAFERFHERSKGWFDLFYNVALDSQGVTYEGRDATIPSQSDLRSWLTLLCVAGDRDPAQPDAFADGILRVWGAVDPTLSPNTIRVHNDRASTACPGPWLTGLVEELKTYTPSLPDLPTLDFEEDPLKLITDTETNRQAAVWVKGGTTYVRWYGRSRAGAGVPMPGISHVIDEQAAKGNVVVVS